MLMNEVLLRFSESIRGTVLADLFLAMSRQQGPDLSEAVVRREATQLEADVKTATSGLNCAETATVVFQLESICALIKAVSLIVVTQHAASHERTDA